MVSSVRPCRGLRACAGGLGGGLLGGLLGGLTGRLLYGLLYGLLDGLLDRLTGRLLDGPLDGLLYGLLDGLLDGLLGNNWWRGLVPFWLSLDDIIEFDGGLKVGIFYFGWIYESSASVTTSVVDNRRNLFILKPNLLIYLDAIIFRPVL